MLMKKTLLTLTAVMILGPALYAGPVGYNVFLNGVNEAPPNASPGTGVGYVEIDIVAHTLLVEVIFSGLIGTTTASHIHCCTTVPFTGTAGVATQTPSFTGFPLGVTGGSYSRTFDLTLLSSYNSSFVSTHGGTASGAEAALAASFAAGTSYLNIHSTFRPGGEIRGFLQPVPEPGTFLFAGAALAGLALFGKSRHR
jgi:hypothetical protein